MRGFHGLDLYSMYTSIHAVLEYLDRVDPKSAQVARKRYGCLTPWQSDPAVYGQAMLTGDYHSCEQEVSLMLRDLLQKRRAYAEHDGERFWMPCRMRASSPARNATTARCTTDRARRGTCAMIICSRRWRICSSSTAPTSKAIVWAHNSHVGDSAATEMSARDEYNIGYLCRRRFGRACYAIGFGTHQGTVAAASNWDEPMQVKSVRPSLADSYERLSHDSGVPNFMLALRSLPSALADLRQAAARARHRRDLSTRNRAPESLLRSGAAEPVRRVHLVR